MRPRALLVGALLLGMGVALSGCLSESLVGTPVPAFQVVTDRGERVDESTYLGKWLVLDLMATWCQPCKLEVAHLAEVQRVHGDQVVILSIGADPTETTVDLDRFAREHGATWAYALDFNGSVGRAMEMRIIPKLVVVDPQGIVRLEREGEVLPAAIMRVIDPSAAPPEGRLSPTALVPVLLGAALGALAPFNPYRRLHRDTGARLPALLALAAAGVLALLAWRHAALVSTRATYGSLALGVLTLGALAWWLRARGKAPRAAGRPQALLEAGDRLYEWAPHFALALVLALSGVGALGFFGPLVAFGAGVLLALAAWPRIPEASREPAGLAGLLLAGLGLVAFGARILAA